MRAAIYARVSTRDQDNENQLLQLRQFASSQGLASTNVKSKHARTNIVRGNNRGCS